MKFNIFKRKEILHEEEITSHEDRKNKIKLARSENDEATRMLNEERALIGIL